MRREAVLDAAESLFLSKSFEATTLNDVVKKSGGSLATIYKLFGTKEQLLVGVLSRQGPSGVNIVRNVRRQSLPPSELLRTILTRLRRRFLNDRAIAMTKIIIAQSLVDPGFSSKFGDQSMELLYDEVTDLFREWQQSGIAITNSPASLASAFLSILMFEMFVKSIAADLTFERSDEQIEEEFQMFLRAIGLANDAP